MPITYLSIHAHFYQPPRENPFTGKIPIESSAAPFLNWNDRIHAECYRPNADLRNFEQISFNVGPTLITWMEANKPETLRNILDQDRRNVARYGVGNAIAQAYNHTILPLSTSRDQATQISWGIADFRHRFGRKPQGMWLPETAVDSQTLRALAERGIQFTILAPWQAEAAELDNREPYRVLLGGGLEIIVFFYDRDLSTKISFDPEATKNADAFARAYLKPFLKAGQSRDGAEQLILVASDGELYGHHQRKRERFLARLLDGASSSLGIQSIYPALWLQQHPVRRTISIRERTSWSCHHGVDRWTGQCPCTPGDGLWKANLRKAFDNLAAELDELYYEMIRPLVSDPWALRERYIQVMLRETSLERLLIDQSGRSFSSQQLERTRLILEAQRERQQMFTSCGWYFEDFDRIEPKNNVAYAAQAVRLARLASGVDFAPQVNEDLKRVISPRTRLNAGELFQRQMQRALEAAN